MATPRQPARTIDGIFGLALAALTAAAPIYAHGKSPVPPWKCLYLFRHHRTEVIPDAEHVALLEKGALESDLVEIEREKAILRLPLAYRALRSTVLPLREVSDERGLRGWREILNETERAEGLARAEKSTQDTSRTLSFGKSSKGFENETGEVKALAEKGYLELRAQMRADGRARRLLQLGPVAIRDFILQTNLRLTQGVKAVTRGETGSPGQLRTFTIGLEDRAGTTAATIGRRLDAFAVELHSRLHETDPDPIRIAAWAYMKVAEEIKPFFDGNGRTGHALLDYILLNFDYPTPTYIGGNRYDEAMKKFRGRHALAMRSETEFRHFLDLSVQETIRESLKAKTIDRTKIVRKNAQGWTYPLGKELGEGTRAVSLLSADAAGNPNSLKIAKNESAPAEFRKELEVIRFLAEHDGSARDTRFPHVIPPTFAEIAPDSTWLAKDFVPGRSGLEILASGPLSSEQVSKLEALYGDLKSLRDRYGIQLDLLPENVVWHEESRTWRIIDFGPRMTYLDLKTFDRYFAQHWVKRTR
jgi:Fic family protein